MLGSTNTFSGVTSFHAKRIELLTREMIESFEFNPMILMATRIRGKSTPGHVDLRFAVEDDNRDKEGLCTLVCIDLGEDGNEFNLIIPLDCISSTDPFTHTTPTGVTYELQAIGRLRDLQQPPLSPRFLEKYKLLANSSES